VEIEFNYCYNHNNYFIFVLRWYYFYEKLFKRILQATYIFYVRVTVNSNKVPFNKTNTRTNVPNLFYQEILHVSDSSSAHHQEFSTVHSALVHVMRLWLQLSNTTRMKLQFHPGRAWKLSSKLHDIYQCRIYSGKLLMMGRGTARNM